jgi:hypothetical protein
MAGLTIRLVCGLRPSLRSIAHLAMDPRQPIQRAKHAAKQHVRANDDLAAVVADYENEGRLRHPDLLSAHKLQSVILHQARSDCLKGRAP